MKHYDDTGELGNFVVGDSGGYGGSGEYCVSIGSGESSDAGDTGYTVNLVVQRIWLTCESDFKIYYHLILI